MSRPKGIIETKPRRPRIKQRKDKGKKRKKYRGKPCEHKPRKYYNKKIGNKKDFWMWLWWRKKMSKDGRKNWKSWLRPKLYTEVTDWNSVKPMRVPFPQINTKTKIENFVANRCWGGKWIVMGGCNAKTKGHFKPVPICTIFVKETSKGNVGRIIDNKRLSKYSWFYKG